MLDFLISNISNEEYPLEKNELKASSHPTYSMPNIPLFRGVKKTFGFFNREYEIRIII